MSKKDDYIIEMATRGKKDSYITVPVMINYKDIYVDMIPDAHKEELLEDGTTRITDILFQLVLSKSDNKNNRFDQMQLAALEHIGYINENGEHLKEKESNTLYALITSKEKEIIDKKQGVLDAGEPIPPSLLEVKMENEYLYDISYEYSKMLEDYLSDGMYEISSFYDLLVPVVEHARPTLVKASVIYLLSVEQENWVNYLSNNMNLATSEIASRYSSSSIPTNLKGAVKDVQEAINNYMNCTLNVFSILSARKRGADVTTSELIRSCPELTTENALLSKATPTLYVSPLSIMLPLFSLSFMENYLMGNIPLFLINEDSESESVFFGCDIFKAYKESLLYNINILLKDLVAQGNKVEQEILPKISSGTTNIVMSGMYDNYLKNTKTGMGLRSLLDSKYSCYFVDIVVYTEALKLYKNKQVKDFTLFDFLNLVSPVLLTREEI